MSDSPYIPFYTSDFLGGTSGMTSATKGVYITLLCLMYEGEGPLPQRWDALARRCGCTLPSFKKAIEDLCDDGKITIVDGGIWSEKCAKHLAQRGERRSSARAAAEIRWEKDKQKQGKPNASASSAQCQPEPEPEPYKRDTNVSPSKPPFGFDEWWNEAPRKKGKGAAIKAYASALKKASPEILLSQIKAYAESRRGEDEQYTAHPATWLNQERWLDEPTIPSKPNGGPNGRTDYASKRKAADESRIDAISEIGRQFDGSRGRGGNQDPSGWGVDGGADRDPSAPFLKLASR